MKSVIFINFLLASLISTVSSIYLGKVNVAIQINYVPPRYKFVLIPYGVVTPVDNSIEPGFEIFVQNVLNPIIVASDVICLAFKDAAGTDFLGWPFGAQFHARISDTPDPAKVGSLYCADMDGVQAQIKRAQKSRGIKGVRSLPPVASEGVDGVELNVDSEDDIPIDNSIVP